MAGFCDALSAAGVSAMRFNFPYIEAGGRAPVRRRTRSPRSARPSRRRPLAPAAGRCSPAARATAGASPRWPPPKDAGRRPRVPRLSAARARASRTSRVTHISTTSAAHAVPAGTKDPFATPEVLRPVLKKLGNARPSFRSRAPDIPSSVSQGQGRRQRRGARTVRGRVRPGARLMPRKNKRAPLEYQPSPAPSGNPRAPSWASQTATRSARSQATRSTAVRVDHVVLPACDTSWSCPRVRRRTDATGTRNAGAGNSEGSASSTVETTGT